jgi:hypothetical protein
VAAVLRALGDARLDGEIRDRAGEIDYVRAWLQHASSGRGGRTAASGAGGEG